MTDGQTTNLEKVRLWKTRLNLLFLKNGAMANRFKVSLVTVSRWLNPDVYGLPPAERIDEVESWLSERESVKNQ